MIVAGQPNVHLTYCTNIHPGETWAEVLANIETKVAAVKRLVAPDQDFGVGLRLSGQAARELARPAVLAAFRAFLASSGLYVFTLNGFPYGRFHGAAIKERVYRPDWLEDERLAYTDLLAGLLCDLLPSDTRIEGSVSTVPGCFRDRADGADACSRMADRILRHAVTLWRLREQRGRTIALALEPEPHCAIETTGEAIAFFEQHLFSAPAIVAFQKATGLAHATAEQTLRRHLGVCFDACHAAVEFEDPVASVCALQAAGVCIVKTQLGAGLRITPPTPQSLKALGAFAEGVYLHQTVKRDEQDGLRRFVDLPQALSGEDADGRHPALTDEWRVHFHVPLFRRQLGPFENTQDFLSQLLALQARESFCRHFEVETYTWDVLPGEFRSEPVVDAVARELHWVIDVLARERAAR